MYYLALTICVILFVCILYGLVRYAHLKKIVQQSVPFSNSEDEKVPLIKQYRIHKDFAFYSCLLAFLSFFGIGLFIAIKSLHNPDWKISNNDLKIMGGVILVFTLGLRWIYVRCSNDIRNLFK